MPYAVPGDDIVAIIDSPPTPSISVSPDGRNVLLVHYESHLPIGLLARPVLRLGGVRVDPSIRGRQRTVRLSGLTVVSSSDGTPRSVKLPDGLNVGVPSWSPDGRRFHFLVDEADHIAVWVADADELRAAPVEGLGVCDILTGGQTGGSGPVCWSRDGHSLLALESAGAPEIDLTDPPAPHVDETAGKTTQMATFQDLLATAADERRFEQLAETQLVRVDIETGSRTALGEPGLIWSFEESPDGAHILVRRVVRPFSFRVPFQYFTRRVEVWSSDTGAIEATPAELPVSDDVPRQGVPTGPRRVGWEEVSPATLLWLEALDGGDPTVPAEHRDVLVRSRAPFIGRVQAFRTRHRCLGWYHLDQPGGLLVSEHDRDRRWRTTWLVDLERPGNDRVLFDMSMHEAYADPGVPLLRTHPNGRRTVVQDGTSIFLRGPGATPEGYRPFLDRFDLRDGTVERLLASPPGAIETVVALLAGRHEAVVRRESRTEPPNFFVVPLAGGNRRALTDFADPHPQLTGMIKVLRTHHRPDGVALSGVLHLPPGHEPARDGRLPLLLWAYPMDYGDAATAGQVRGTDQGFARLAGTSPLWFVLRGFAVLLDATMPVIGDPETMNDTYVDQITAAARAHIDALDADGIIDPSRVLVAGHSYGAFMTANLLAHTDLFRAGIARSGAYNRTLTPFGFQTERRSFWEAPAVYDAVSPFRHADRIRAPLLLIHGAADNNSGTFTVQSERLFQALQGTGGTARLVLLPHESHGYQARESVLHVLAEQFEWAQRWV